MIAITFYEVKNFTWSEATNFTLQELHCGETTTSLMYGIIKASLSGTVKLFVLLFTLKIYLKFVVECQTNTHILYKLARGFYAVGFILRCDMPIKAYRYTYPRFLYHVLLLLVLEKF